MARKKNKELSELDIFLLRTLNNVGEEKMLAHVASSLKENLRDLDKEIEEETAFAKENPPRSTYGSAGGEARQRVKYLKRVRKYQCELIRKFSLCIKMKDRIDKMW